MPTTDKNSISERNSKYGHWDVTLISKEEAAKIIKFLQEYVGTPNNK
jgi:hypothetical protein